MGRWISLQHANPLFIPHRELRMEDWHETQNKSQLCIHTADFLFQAFQQKNNSLDVYSRWLGKEKGTNKTLSWLLLRLFI
jgi:hypothetical protein